MLSEYNKLELIDNQKNGKVMQTRNPWQTVSELKVLTDEYALLKSTKNSEKAFKILSTSSGERIIAVVSTVYVDNKPDSSLEFYDLNWSKLDASNMMDEPVSNKFRYIELSKDNDTMSIIYGNPLDVSLNGSLEQPKIATEKITKTWNGTKFE